MIMTRRMKDPYTEHDPGVILRKPGMRDRRKVKDLLRTAENFSNDEIETAIELLEDSLSNPYEYMCLITENIRLDRITGFICFGKTPMTDRTFDIYWLTVSPDNRRKGHGAMLFEAAQTLISESKARMLVAETSSRGDYASARKFYLKQGCIEAAHIPDYYKKGEDLVVFTKILR